MTAQQGNTEEDKVTTAGLLQIARAFWPQILAVTFTVVAVAVLLAMFLSE